MSNKIIDSTTRRGKLTKRLGILSSLMIGLGIILLMPGRAEAIYKQGNRWPGSEIRVCWLPAATSHASFATYSRWTREAVDNSWGKLINIQFTGWQACPADTRGMVAIQFSDTTQSDWTTPVGYVSGSTTYVNLADDTEEGFKGDAMHEFGHVLGFGHEMDRPGNPYIKPNGCWGTVQPGDPLGTPYDEQSIMSYCRLQRAKLSPWDIVGVQNLYGRKVSGSVVGLNNRCLDVPGANTTAGTQLQVYNCNGGVNQQWVGARAANLYTVMTSATRCVDVPGGAVSPSSGTILQSYYCNGGANQQFTFDSVEIRGMGNKCLDVPSGSYFPGQYVQLYDCQGGANQKWSIEPGGRIRAGTSGYCLDVPDGTPVSGKLLQLYPCHDGAAQRFSFSRLGEIQFGGLCFDSQGGVPDNGSKLQLYSCKADGFGKRNQQWHLSGPIRGLGGQCLDIRGGVGTDFAKAQLYPCSAGAANQTWDYYFK